MQVDKKKIIAIVGIVVVILGLIGVLVISTLQDKKRESEFYYKFKYDDNLISQSVWVYNGNDELQTNYYLYYNDSPIAFTKGEKAVVTMMKVDLKDKQELVLRFKNEEKTYKVTYKED